MVDAERLWLVPGRGKVLVAVQVKNTRVSYGRTQFLVEPLAGRGARWVDAESTRDVEEEEE
ncbi:hypothetical protein [Frankia sp. Cj3]|uniref:hypothetical protein n=1 Tax=Frankia sp. Cj3 TaxID=2880976 RepID=UPI001EF4EB28|nr:hypothetical protein [Frankia sp. Cj3]